MNDHDSSAHGRYSARVQEARTVDFLQVTFPCPSTLATRTCYLEAEPGVEPRYTDLQSAA